MQPETQPRYSIRSSFGYWVTLLARSMEADFEDRLAVYGMTRASWTVLNAIAVHEKKTTTELAEFIGIDPAAVTRHLDRIVKQGLVSRRRSAKDRRSVNLKVTAEGAELVPRIAEESMATNEKFLAGIEQSESDAMQTTIRKMLSNSDVKLGEL